MFGARVKGDLAFSVVVVCCSENRAPFLVSGSFFIWWVKAAFGGQSQVHLSASFQGYVVPPNFFGARQWIFSLQKSMLGTLKGDTATSL